MTYTFLDLLATWKSNSALYPKRNLAQTITMGFGRFKAVIKEGEAKTERQTDQDSDAYLPSTDAKLVTGS